jgi:hypothetical protein
MFTNGMLSSLSPRMKTAFFGYDSSDGAHAHAGNARDVIRRARGGDSDPVLPHGGRLQYFERKLELVRERSA